MDSNRCRPGQVLYSRKVAAMDSNTRRIIHPVVASTSEGVVTSPSSTVNPDPELQALMEVHTTATGPALWSWWLYPLE